MYCVYNNTKFCSVIAKITKHKSRIITSNIFYSMFYVQMTRERSITLGDAVPVKCRCRGFQTLDQALGLTLLKLHRIELLQSLLKFLPNLFKGLINLLH